MPELPPIPKVLPGGKMPGKVMVVQTFYHSLPNSMPFAVDTRDLRWLNTDKEYVAAEGMIIPKGLRWLDLKTFLGPLRVPEDYPIGTVIVESLVGKNVQCVPSEQEREIIEGTLIEVKIGTRESPNLEELGIIQVYPGCTERITTLFQVSLRSIVTEAPCNIYLFPR